MDITKEMMEAEGYDYLTYEDLEDQYEELLNELYPEGVMCCGEHMGESGKFRKRRRSGAALFER